MKRCSSGEQVLAARADECACPGRGKEKRPVARAFLGVIDGI